MQLCSVEHKLNTSSTFFSSKLDSPVIKTLERIRFSSDQNIGEVESNFDEKNVEKMFNWSEVHSEKKYYLYNRDFSSKYFVRFWKEKLQ